MQNERIIADHNSEYHIDNCDFPYWANRSIKRKLHILDMREFDKITGLDIMKINGIGFRLLKILQTKLDSMGLRLKNG